MNISKLAPVFCALAVGALCLSVRAEDNAAQAAARLALAKQLFEQDSHQGTNNAPVAVTQAAAPQAKAVTDTTAAKPATANSKPKKTSKKKKLPAQPAVDATAASNASNAQATPAAPARASWDTQQQAAAPQPVAQPAPVTPPVVHPAPAPAVQPVVQNNPADGDNAAQAAARMALAKQLFNEQGTTTTATRPVTVVATKPSTNATKTSESVPAPAPTPVVAASKPVSAPAGDNNNYVGRSLGLKQIVAPPLPISASKQAKLDELLNQYKADRITPEQYHQQRAAILAEP